MVGYADRRPLVWLCVLGMCGLWLALLYVARDWAPLMLTFAIIAMVLRIMFPHFAALASATAALLIATIPLGLSAWLMPLVIARLNRLVDAMSFPVCLMVMSGSMVRMNRWIGINGQAWACLRSALFLFTTQLALVTWDRLLFRQDAIAETGDAFPGAASDRLMAFSVLSGICFSEVLAGFQVCRFTSPPP